jgi:hypothetical protein
MTICHEMRPAGVYMGRLPHGADLLEALTELCREKSVTLGRVEAMGAVRSATIGYYDQSEWTYGFHEISEPLEILTLVGNVSLKDGEVMVHAHVTLAHEDGRAVGGHLAAGTPVFACEYVIEAFDGTPLLRSYDEETGLPLWSE